MQFSESFFAVGSELCAMTSFDEITELKDRSIKNTHTVHCVKKLGDERTGSSGGSFYG